MPGGSVWTVPRPPVLGHRAVWTLERDGKLGGDRGGTLPPEPQSIMRGPKVIGNPSRVVPLASVSDLSLYRSSELARGPTDIHPPPYLFLSLPLPYPSPKFLLSQLENHLAHRWNHIQSDLLCVWKERMHMWGGIIVHVCAVQYDNRLKCN